MSCIFLVMFVDEVGETCGTHGESKMYRVLVGNPEGKRLPGRPRRRWKDGIRMDLRKICWGVWSGSR
jgi:hypothetical protein